MGVPRDEPNSKHWWQNEWPRAALIHPLFALALLMLVFWITGDEGTTPPLTAALPFTAAASGTVLTLVMVIRRPAIGMNERVVLVITSAMATLFVLYGAFLAAVITGHGPE